MESDEDLDQLIEEHEEEESQQREKLEEEEQYQGLNGYHIQTFLVWMATAFDDAIMIIRCDQLNMQINCLVFSSRPKSNKKSMCSPISVCD